MAADRADSYRSDTDSVKTAEQNRQAPAIGREPSPIPEQVPVITATGPSSGRPRGRITVRAAVGAFVAADLVALLVVALGVAWAVSQRATAAAVGNARDMTVAEGRAAVWPLLSDGLANHDPAAIAALDTVIRRRVLSQSIVRVKVWAADGTILYSDEPRLIGQRFPLGADEQATLTNGRPLAGVSNLSDAENSYERQFKKLVQVYVGLRTGRGQPVLFEAYLRFSSVNADSHRTMVSLLPAMLAGLGLLFLAQIPLALTMARRLEAGRLEEQRLLHRALSSADVERRHIAADLHDGAVQSLAGTAMSLSAAAERAGTAGLVDVAGQVSDAAGELRQGIRDLRTLIVAIAPPRLHDEGLAAALQDLVSPLAARHIEVELSVDNTMVLPHDVETLAYRTAQEAIRNVVRHAGDAHRVRIAVHQTAGVVHLEVTDDGPGFGAETLAARRGEGHVGLHLLGELASDAGGRLEVRSAPGSGVQVSLELPAR